jgi:hypothetical protein
VHKYIYINSKSTVQNTVDYSRQEKPFGKFTCARTVRALSVDHPRHQDMPRIETMQNSHSHYGLSKGEETTVWDQAWTVRPQARTVRSLKKPEIPEGEGFSKMHFYRPCGPSEVHGRTIHDCFIWHLTTHLMHLKLLPLTIAISVVDVQGRTVRTRVADRPRLTERRQQLESGWWL